MTDVCEKLGLEVHRFPQTDIGLGQLGHLQVEVLIHSPESRLGLLDLIKHGVEILRQHLELVAGPDR